MIDCTDSHFRYLARLLTRHARLYTEMIVANAILFSRQRDRLLVYQPEEHPLALQIAGSCPQLLQQSARIVEDYGFAEINFNVGCPSPRVSAGRFGACMMLEPALVAECVAAMQQVVTIPVTVKTRIGVDNCDSYSYLHSFIDTVAQAGCQTFIIHARKAWLKGLSPKENREIPPLSYETVYQLKRDFPHLQLVINGGITDIAQAQQHLQVVDGVMVGREAYSNPYSLVHIDSELFGDEHSILTREAILQLYWPYVVGQLEKGERWTVISRHLQGFYANQMGAKKWRQMLQAASLRDLESLFISDVA